MNSFGALFAKRKPKLRFVYKEGLHRIMLIALAAMCVKKFGTGIDLDTPASPAFLRVAPSP